MSEKQQANAVPARKSHFKRFWWLYLIVFLVVAVVIVVPVVLLVAVPKIAQDKLNAATLTIDGISVTNARSKSYTMSINSTIHADSSVHATVDAFTGWMYLTSINPPLLITTIEFPQTSTASVQSVNVTQGIDIKNNTAFTTFNEYLLANKSVTVQIKGDTHVHVSGIARAYGVMFNKTLELTGLNGFQGITVTDAKISLATENNFNGTTHIPNPSVLTLDIGNVTFTNYFNGDAIGTTFIKDLVLRPGNNSYFTNATIEQIPIVTALTTQPDCKLDGVLPFQLSGKDVTNNGDELTYFRDALASANQSVTIDLKDAAEAVGIKPGCLTKSA
ncbi:hypothetical protein GGR57DRAFT_98361 [Xylariaceae sp. FL1272]|nr:hypothetical protein GGR57DRAFT_98361 [Xylariaceae sp. FL1272]